MATVSNGTDSAKAIKARNIEAARKREIKNTRASVFARANHLFKTYKADGATRGACMKLAWAERKSEAAGQKAVTPELEILYLEKMSAEWEARSSGRTSWDSTPALDAATQRYCVAKKVVERQFLGLAASQQLAA